LRRGAEKTRYNTEIAAMEDKNGVSNKGFGELLKIIKKKYASKG
jgi:hypothetical protein